MGVFDSLGMLTIGLLVVQAVIVAGFSAFVARQKGRNEGAWFLLGLVFSIIALLAVGLAPSVENEREVVKCPHCGAYAEFGRTESRAGWVICDVCSKQIWVPSDVREHVADCPGCGAPVVLDPEDIVTLAFQCPTCDQQHTIDAGAISIRDKESEEEEIN